MWIADEPNRKQYRQLCTQRLLITENWENQTHEGANTAGKIKTNNTRLRL